MFIVDDGLKCHMHFSSRTFGRELTGENALSAVEVAAARLVPPKLLALFDEGESALDIRRVQRMTTHS
ncbi:hypothetical protein [Microbacterium sp.]|uniref:hypothetical protein n=1 Tax=Microbacterium sp. TaxID=51671 RepID=UPI0028ABB12E|nr:hypothetical protein [Microbacterium sp.]